MAWTGSQYAMSWIDDRTGYTEVYFMRVSAAGVKASSDMMITANMAYNGRPSVAWSGSEIGLAWEFTDTEFGISDVLFTRIRFCE